MLKAGNVQRWYQRSSVFHVESRFGIDTILCKELVDSCAQKFAIDEYVERNAVLISTVEELVYKSRELMAC